MKNIVRIVGSVVVSILLAVGPARGAIRNDYCVTPSFIQSPTKSNLLLMLDNSASMYDPQYTDASGTACYDSSYVNTNDYIGYFSKLDSAGNVTYPVYQYTYNSTTPGNSKFVELTSGVPTTGGTYRTSYLYIEMTGTKGATDRKVYSIIASGRFLNWLSASKFDTQKQVLTGGKYDTTREFLVGESRGCVGRRFVRELPTTAWTFPASPATNPITFAVRGPNSVEPLYNRDTQGGETRIEIYEADFNQTACNTAAQNWIDGNYGTAQTQTGNCLDISGGGNTTTGRTLSTFNHTMQTCWLLKDNIKKGATTATAIWQGVNITDVTGACEKVYTTDLILPATIANESNGNYVCTSAATHLAPIAPWDVLGSDPTGYLGWCWQGSANKFTGNDDCVKRELLHYCMGQEYTEVIDPSSTATTGGGIPAVLMDAGIRAVGDPVGPAGSVAPDNQYLYVHVGVGATPPEGLLQKYGNSIRIGAMRFNDIGTFSETATMPGTAPAGNKDGGKIVSFIGDPGVCWVSGDPCSSDSACSSGVCNFAGSHSAGLVQAVDGITANTWTPFTEAYYNAIGYFVKDAIATNSNLDTTKFTPDSIAIAAPLTGSDTYTNKNPILARCQRNYILMISDGGSTADQNSTMTGKVTATSNYFRDPNTLAETGSTSGVCGIYAGDPYLHDLSYFAKHRNIFHPSVSCVSGSCESAQTITTHVVYTGPATSSLSGVCDPRTQMDRTATNGGTTLNTATDPTLFFSVLNSALTAVVGSGASGTAASILSNSEGSGANLLQAVFYPQKNFATSTGQTTPTSAAWIGEMQNLWYYVDPFISNSTVREDTDYASTTPDHVLNLKNDYVANFYFSNNQTSVELKKDTNGDGTGDIVINSAASPDDVNSIWRAGKQLWARTADSRTIHTSIDGISLLSPTVDTKGGFYSDATRATALQLYLQATDLAESQKIINYVRGIDRNDPADPPVYRNRTVQIGSGASTSANTKVWKLGDIVTSTPRIQSTSKLNAYGLDSPQGYGDKSHKAFTSSANYQKRGMVYVGANDGMLHAFKLGKLTVSGVSDVPVSGGYLSIGGDTKATLTGTNLGEEQWAYIPRNVLPYLKYYAASNNNSPHIYSVDGQTLLADVAIGSCTGQSDSANCTKNVTDGSNWRTVLIGSMGLGGASKITASSCVEGVTGTCVKTPILDPTNSSAGLGYSSVFALDITGQYYNTDGTLANQPTLKWELSRPDLGYTTSGAAIVKISSKTTVTVGGVSSVVADNTKNGKWFAVFASGPTGPINTDTNQFLGKSDQNLKLFVVDLGSTASLEENTNYWVIDTGIHRAFGGVIINSVVDTDRWSNSLDGNYQDDVIYVGYTKANIADNAPITADTTWTEGGVVRIVTGEDPIPGPNPGHWTSSTLISGTGPVTAGVAKLQDRNCKKLWLYFGSGRYYYVNDDKSSQRSIFGVQDPCYKTDNTFDKACNAATLGLGDLIHRTTTCADIGSNKGWYISLGTEDTDNNFDAERLISDPSALTSGTVFFSSFRPTSDVCNYGGKTYMRAVSYNNGCLPYCNTLTGKALLQMSTGSFEQADFSSLFACYNAPRTSCDGNLPSVPPPIIPPTPPPGPSPPSPPSPSPVPQPTQGWIGKGPPEFPVVTNSGNKPVKKILHLQEK